ncbi:hypothetical protein niasHT_007575 [Heterodera trifolii]|uniref:Uncharacterized protein n=1 Tax=Heterodera trifolii TaxID=157864 RepID=A0ABD2LPJ5_9BILA
MLLLRFFRQHFFFSLLLLFAFLVILPPVCSRYEDRYNMNMLPWDLKPVQDFIGLWQMDRSSGNFKELPPPNLIDLAINPIPKFGARTMNITHTYLDSARNVIRSDYGFMPVKNATRRDPRVHVAYLTTSSEGWSMMEQGFFKDGKLIFHLKQFLKRSFGAGSNLDIREFERQFELSGFHSMTLKVRAETSFQTEAYTACAAEIIGESATKIIGDATKIVAKGCQAKNRLNDRLDNGLQNVRLLLLNKRRSAETGGRAETASATTMRRHAPLISGDEAVTDVQRTTGEIITAKIKLGEGRGKGSAEEKEEKRGKEGKKRGHQIGREREKAAHLSSGEGEGKIGNIGIHEIFGRERNNDVIRNLGGKVVK